MVDYARSDAEVFDGTAQMGRLFQPGAGLKLYVFVNTEYGDQFKMYTSNFLMNLYHLLH